MNRYVTRHDVQPTSTTAKDCYEQNNFHEILKVIFILMLNRVETAHINTHTVKYTTRLPPFLVADKRRFNICNSLFCSCFGAMHSTIVSWRKNGPSGRNECKGVIGKLLSTILQCSLIGKLFTLKYKSSHDDWEV